MGLELVNCSSVLMDFRGYSLFLTGTCTAKACKRVGRQFLDLFLLC